MFEGVMFVVAKKIFSFNSLFSGFDASFIFKYDAISYRNHPKLARYKIRTDPIEETETENFQAISKRFLYAFYVFYMVYIVIIPVHLWFSMDDSNVDEIKKFECLNKDYFVLNLFAKLSCFIKGIEAKTIWSPELFLYHISLFLQSLMGRFFCIWPERYPDLVELRSLFDRQRELDRLKCCISRRLRWFKRSIEAHKEALMAQLNHVREDSLEGENLVRYLLMIEINKNRIGEFISKPEILTPREFNEEYWIKLRDVFTRTVLGIITLYLIVVISGLSALYIVYCRIRCRITANCNNELILSTEDFNHYIVVAILSVHTLLTHSIFPMILAILQYAHNELISGWLNLIGNCIKQLDNIDDVYRNSKVSQSFIESMSERISFDAFIRANIYQIELERINYALSICFRIPIASGVQPFIACLILLPTKPLNVSKELLVVICTTAWIATNVYSIQCSIASAKVTRIETNTWYLMARIVGHNGDQTNSCHVYDRLSSILWRRLVTSYIQSRFNYSPHPFGLDIDFHMVMEFNFYIMSGIIIVENLFMSTSINQ